MPCPLPLPPPLQPARCDMQGGNTATCLLTPIPSLAQLLVSTAASPPSATPPHTPACSTRRCCIIAPTVLGCPTAAETEHLSGLLPPPSNPIPNHTCRHCVVEIRGPWGPKEQREQHLLGPHHAVDGLVGGVAQRADGVGLGGGLGLALEAFGATAQMGRHLCVGLAWGGGECGMRPFRGGLALGATMQVGCHLAQVAQRCCRVVGSFSTHTLSTQ